MEESISRMPSDLGCQWKSFDFFSFFYSAGPKGSYGLGFRGKETTLPCDDWTEIFCERTTWICLGSSSANEKAVGALTGVLVQDWLADVRDISPSGRRKAARCEFRLQGV